MPSTDEAPVSSAASCTRSIVAAGVAWLIVKPPEAVASLPAASVVDTCRPTAPSGRPPAGSVPDVGVAVARSTLQAPVTSVVAV